MYETFEQVLVKDDRLGCITSTIKFQILKGGQNVTYQPLKTISETKTSHAYNVKAPKVKNCYSREVLGESTMTLKITCANKSASEFLIR